MKDKMFFFQGSKGSIETQKIRSHVWAATAFGLGLFPLVSKYIKTTYIGV